MMGVVGLFVGAALVLAGYWLGSRRPGELPARRPSKCTRWGHCEAPAWHACVDGCCRHHCAQTCNCAPIGQPGKLTAIKGGAP